MSTHSLRADLPSPQRKSLRMEANVDPKRLRISTPEEFKRAIGRAIETALKAADISKKEAAQTMGYGENQSTVTAWITGEETPQFAKLWMLGPRFRQELVIALAGLCDIGVEIETIVKIRRTA